MAVDIIMLTKNSMLPCLKECVQSIYQHVPVSRFIVVDGGSTDETLGLISKYPNVLIISDPFGNRATARQLGIEASRTEFVLMVDSDVVLCENWYNKASRFLTEHIGAIWGSALQRSTSDYARYRAMGMFYGMDEVALAVRHGKKRGLTHDTLIRRKALDGLRIPADLAVLEDHYIRMHVESKGYVWLSVEDPYCLHYAHNRERPKDWYEFGRAARSIGFLEFRNVLVYIVFGLPKSLWILASTRNAHAAKVQLDTYYHIVRGWFGV